MNEQVDVEGGGEGDAGRAAGDVKAAIPAGYPFSVSKVLATAFRITKRNFVPFFVLACVLQLPGLLLSLGGVLPALLGLLLTFFVNALTAAVVSYGVIMELHGSRPSARACIANGFGHLGAVIGVSLLSTLAIFGATLLLIIPGIVVMLMFYVVVPVAIIEQVGATDALRRSRELTQDRKGDLFLVVLFGGAVNIGLELFAHYELGPDAAIVWRSLTSAFTTMFFSVTTAVAYVELRKLREGTQVPELATAFARIRK